MDVVVVDVPTKYGMLLSRSWGAKLGGYLQLDMTYATIPLFGGKYTRLYRETKLAYTVSDPKNPNNYHVYVVDQDLGSCILSVNSELEDFSEIKQIDHCESLVDIEEGMWKMFFDGASSWEGSGAGILFVSPSGNKIIPFSFRLQFETDSTNNVCEYEALVIGLETTRKLKIKHLVVYGDVELIVKQIRKIYQAKHPRMRAYKNCVWDLIENFFLSFNIHAIPIIHNQQADSLVVATSTFRPPNVTSLEYQIQLRHRPSIPDNVQHWQVFEDDQQIKQFLEMEEEFSEIHIDQENQNDAIWTQQENQTDGELKNKIVDHKMLLLKNNQIPKGLIPLEIFFYQNDIPLKPFVQPQLDEVEDCNIGTEKNPKFVKLSKYLPAEQKQKYVELLKEYSGVFSWSYEDLRTYDTNIIQHKIPLKPGVKPFRQKLRQINPILLPVIEKELKNYWMQKSLYHLDILFGWPILCLVRKKNGEIRLCVDFRNLNRSSLKDNYPLPKMDHILQRVVGANRISMIDGFSGYNQIAVQEEEREKTAFTTPWGTFMYDKIPFGLMNAGATFQRAMDIAFVGEKDKFVVIYLDDLTIFSDSDEEHLKHLRHTFEKCKKYGLSLNPKKSHFSM
jgi:ribonuclease HI